MRKRSKSSRNDPKRQPGARQTEDELLLEFRPAHARHEFTHTDPWRVLRIMGEFVEGFDEMSDIDVAIAMFGSARVLPDDPWYQLAVETSRRFGEAGIAVITGGGPGIMEAGNKGARESETLSIGLNIELPHEQGVNPYVDRAINFHYFFVRKMMFVKYASAFVVFPGGFGTLDELFEALTLIQTGKIHNFPVLLMGSTYWQGLVDWCRTALVNRGMISPQDIRLFRVTDDPEEAVRIVVDSARRARRRSGRHLFGRKED